MYSYFDAHCDTLSRCLGQGWSLWENPGHLDLKRLSAYEQNGQVFALFADSAKVPAEERFRTISAQAALLHEPKGRTRRGWKTAFSRWRERSCWAAMREGWKRSGNGA